MKSDYYELLALAESGDTDAQYRISQNRAFVEHGIITMEDATTWLENAALGGHKQATLRLSESMEHRKCETIINTKVVRTSVHKASPRKSDASKKLSLQERVNQFLSDVHQKDPPQHHGTDNNSKETDEHTVEGNDPSINDSTRRPNLMESLMTESILAVQKRRTITVKAIPRASRNPLCYACNPYLKYISTNSEHYSIGRVKYMNSLERYLDTDFVLLSEAKTRESLWRIENEEGHTIEGNDGDIYIPIRFREEEDA